MVSEKRKEIEQKRKSESAILGRNKTFVDQHKKELKLRHKNALLSADNGRKGHEIRQLKEEIGKLGVEIGKGRKDRVATYVVGIMGVATTISGCFLTWYLTTLSGKPRDNDHQTHSNNQTSQANNRDSKGKSVAFPFQLSDSVGVTHISKDTNVKVNPVLKQGKLP